MLKEKIFLAVLIAGLGQVTLADNKLLPIIDLNISGQAILAEVAATPATLATGLMYRQHLIENSGMLFVFPEAGIHVMWMKNTWIPLSVAFIDAEGIIINIADMEPNTLKQHHSAKTASFALEMNQGWFAKYAIQTGDQVRGLEGIENASWP
ncbi:DUF192 domain-containing protein [Nitrosomonas mobilis]|uniref:DUF192 domain-containing protein n=1 Tax=Nitrosomonas mobilis TaxID=51642 RepID=A0A1G5SE08_9PROT|nr:DUF192 domain-containing protein [Nitrosomonas mobilis]SCZ85227.1 conserved exported hypothetical protein [Nitrosomonas mobilis]